MRSSSRTSCGCLNFSQPTRTGCSFAPNPCEAPEKEPFELFRNNAFILEGQVFQPGGTTPQNLNGWLMWFTVKYYLADVDGRAVWQDRSDKTGTLITFPTPTSGLYRAKMPAIATRGFPDAMVCLIYDVQVKDPVSGDPFTVSIGKINVIPGVTRAIV